MEKRGLGRGLNSLFGEYDLDFNEDFKNPPVKEEKIEKTVAVESKTNKNQPDTNHIEVEIGLIDRNPQQPRRNFDEKALAELAQSIKTHGIIQPLIVVKNGDRYTLVAGERRWRASKIAGIKTVPIVIKNYNEQQMAEIAIIENLQREDLNPIESARAIKELMVNYNITQEKVADKIGKSRSAVANTLRLLNLPDSVIELILQNKLSAGHARVLLALEDDAFEKELALKCVEKKYSVRDLEKLIKKIKTNKTSAKVEKSVELNAFIKDLNTVFGTKVNVLGNDNKGRIIINYYSADDLQRIYDIINK